MNRATAQARHAPLPRVRRHRLGRGSDRQRCQPLLARRERRLGAATSRAVLCRGTRSPRSMRTPSRLQVASKVTCVPILSGTGGSFAGLFSLDLPASIHVGVGLGGRDRKTSSDAERARSAVTKCIRNAIQKIGHAIPSLVTTWPVESTLDTSAPILRIQNDPLTGSSEDLLFSHL